MEEVPTVTSTGGPAPAQTVVAGFFYVNDLALYDHDNNPGTQRQLFTAIGKHTKPIYDFYLSRHQ